MVRRDEDRSASGLLVVPRYLDSPPAVLFGYLRFEAITDRFGRPVGSQVNFPTAGMNVTFANRVRLVAYSVSDVAIRERRGDRVQLCFLGRVEGTQGCNPGG